MRALAVIILALAASSGALAQPRRASGVRADVEGQLASAIAGTEACDYDVDEDRVAAILRQIYGARLSPGEVSSLVKRIVTIQAVQGVQLKNFATERRAAYCADLVRRYGVGGTELRGVVK